MRVLRHLTLIACLVASASPALADEAWDRQVRQAEEQEDRELDQARQRGTTRQLVARYASRLSRNPTPLNHFLLGRAYYYDGDPESAERHLTQALTKKPEFWQARLRLAILKDERGDAAGAKQLVTQVLRVRPGHGDALRLLARMHMKANDWDRALQVLDDLLNREPTNDEIRRNIAYCHMEKGDWTSALHELRILRGRSPGDPGVRWYYAIALHETGDLKEAAKEFEGLVRLDARDLRALDMLRKIYASLEDAENLLRTLERMRPLVQEEEVKTKIDEWIARIQEGASAPTPSEEEFPQDPWMLLVEACVDPTDVEVRRKALQQYFEAQIPLMPRIMIRRVHWDVEPDPICRSWLLRIIGSLKNEQLAKVAALGLFDPDVQVRSIAAETIAQIGVPSGMLYLLAFFRRMDLEGTVGPETEGEFNAARAALVRLTDFRDSAGGADDWVKGMQARAVRAEWEAWLGTEEGVDRRLKAIADLEAMGDLHLERYLIDQVLDENIAIARSAFLIMNRKAGREEAQAENPAWRNFPRVETDGLTRQNLPEMQSAVRAWWDEWLAAEDARNRGDG
ncbi:MAG: tetratricopeptide repeat protein [Planctomycetota bacterium]